MVTPVATSEMEDSSKHFRDHIKSQIPQTISTFLSTTFDKANSGAIRILGDTPTSILTADNPVGCICEFAHEVETAIRKTSSRQSGGGAIQTRFLAVTIYPTTKTKHSYFVVDLNNTEYDYETAHNDLRKIPVYVLRLSKRKISIFRQERLDGTIAETLAMMHKGHGDDPLPLVDDFTGVMPVQYKYPRA